jgi:hypothetical protein
MQLLLDIQEPGQTLLAQHWMAAIFSPSGLAGKQKKTRVHLSKESGCAILLSRNLTILR